MAPAAAPEPPPAMGDPDEDLFGGQELEGVRSSAALSVAAGKEKEESPTGIASGPVGTNSDEVRGTATGSRTHPHSDSLPHRLCSVDMCEVFSPPRVGKEASKFGMNVGDAMDLTTGWDFNIPDHRRRAEEFVDREKPLVLIGSPPCVAFSQLQTLVPDSQRKANQLAEGIRHMEFVVKLYRKQVEG